MADCDGGIRETAVRRKSEATNFSGGDAIDEGWEEGIVVNTGNRFWLIDI